MSAGFASHPCLPISTATHPHSPEPAACAAWALGQASGPCGCNESRIFIYFDLLEIKSVRLYIRILMGAIDYV